MSAEAQGPLVEHPQGKDHEKQHPETATEGQETAASHKPPLRETAGGNGVGGGHAATPAKPSHPEMPTPPAPAPPEEAPADPAAAAPETKERCGQDGRTVFVCPFVRQLLPYPTFAGM